MLGKNAIAKALTEMDYRQSEAYLRGARHVQMEPVWGGQEDTASALRGICLLGLVTCSDVRRETVLRCLVDALTERAQTVRVEAVRALAEMGGDESALLLRLKARAGDKEPPVVGQAFDSLLRLEGAEAVGFIAEFLNGQSERCAGGGGYGARGVAIAGGGHGAAGGVGAYTAIRICGTHWCGQSVRRGRSRGLRFC